MDLSKLYKHPFVEKSSTFAALSIGSVHLNPKEEKLKSAFESGDKAAFISALSTKPEIDMVQRNGSPILNLCLQKNYTEMAEALIKAGVDISKVDFENRNALQIAIATGQNNLVRTMIQNNTKSSNPKEGPSTPLHTAALFGNTEAIEILLSSKADANAKDFEGKTALHLAIQVKQIPAVKALIEKTNLTLQDSKGVTPLIEAVKVGEIDVVSMLLTADPQAKAMDLRDEEGYNALYWSVVSKKLDIFQFLLNSGMSTIPQKKGETFTTLLHVAARVGAPEVMELLKKHDANQPDSSGRTPLLEAVQSLKSNENHTIYHECMRLLLQQGADPNAMEKNESGLHFCVKNGFVDALVILLQAEADPDLPDSEGETPASIAVHKHIENLSKKEAGLYSPILDRQMIQCVQALATHKADLDSRNRFGQTLMHLCVTNIDSTMGTTLLDAGAHPLKKDSYGNTPIHVAAKDPRNREHHEYLFGYPMIQECMAIWWTYKRRSMWRSMSIFVVFLVMVTALALVEVTGDDFASFGISSGMRQLLVDREFNDMTFADIANPHDVREWGHQLVIPALCSDDAFSYESQNTWVSKARVRVKRVLDRDLDSCPSATAVQSWLGNRTLTCRVAYSAAHESTTNFTGFQFTNTSGENSVSGYFAEYNAGGFVSELTCDNMTPFFDRLLNVNDTWIDPNTRAVIIETILYNPSINMFLIARYLIETAQTGTIATTSEFYTAKIFPYVSTGNWVMLAFELILVLFVLYFILEECMELRNSVRHSIESASSFSTKEVTRFQKYSHGAKQFFWKCVYYFSELWNLLDLLIIGVLGIYCVLTSISVLWLWSC